MNNLSLSRNNLNNTLDQEQAQPILQKGWKNLETRSYQKSLKVGDHFLTIIVSKDIGNSYIVFIEINGKRHSIDNIRANNLEMALNQTETIALECISKHDQATSETSPLYKEIK
ncbi:hypothetical protein [Neisseria sp. Ec49-e6-T10]|uniref:hypothetical protein n=1 Tax=Neisseria sp. Ec49-e6-T10 TaxID=3140744 RepID=UPI003EB7C380